MRPHGSPVQLEQRRLQAVVLFERGVPPVDVAQRLKVGRRSVRRWKANFLKNGRKAMKAQPASGRPAKLATTRKERLAELLLKGAQSAGYPTDLWTCPRVADLIERKLHVRYHVDHIGRLLHSMGWSPQKPERRARERDEKAIRRWVRVDWPDIKKKPAD